MENSKGPKFAFAGDREIAVQVLNFILAQGLRPSALLVSDQKRSSHFKELVNLCDFLPSDRILEGKQFCSSEGLKILAGLKTDYIFCIHFPYLVPKEVLDLPRHGVLNLHPAYLPYNRGWHTPTWAIIDKTPYGATLHFMDENLDTGDIVHQKAIKILPQDNAHTLYQRVLALEFEVFKEAWPWLLRSELNRTKQVPAAGSLHKSSDLKHIQDIDLNEQVRCGDLLDKLRALTTSRVGEGALITVDNKKYRVQLSLIPEVEKGEDPELSHEDRFANWRYPVIEEGKLTKYNWLVQNVHGLQLGHRTDVGAYTYINAKNGVILEDNVQIGSHSSIYSVSTIDGKGGPVHIKKNACLGSHSVVMPGVTIGENALVGAFSFINKDIPDNSVAFGVPAKVKLVKASQI